MRQASSHASDYWRNALNGQFGTIEEVSPQPGKYRVQRGKGGPWVPVSIHYEQELDQDTGQLEADEELVCLVGFKDDQTLVDAQEMWTWVAKHPITEDLYFEAFEAGDWPDRSRGVGDNNPPPDNTLPGIADEADVLIGEVEAALRAGLKTKEDADKATNLRDRLTAAWKKADAARAEEKRPYDDGASSVQVKWKPLLNKITTAKDRVASALTPLLRQLEEAAVKRAAETISAGQRPPEVTAKVGGGFSGRRTGLRTRTSIEVTDYDAALTFVKGNPEVRAAVEAVALRLVKAGAEVPGVKVIKNRSV